MCNVVYKGKIPLIIVLILGVIKLLILYGVMYCMQDEEEGTSHDETKTDKKQYCARSEVQKIVRRGDFIHLPTSGGGGGGGGGEAPHPGGGGGVGPH
jgi:hypothetical protein